MKQTVSFFCIGLLVSMPVFSATNCFLVKENNQVIIKEGDCQSRYSPCSTFKIAISLMAYNEGLLNDEKHPELPFKTGYTDHVECWKQPHNPIMWMKNSCIWYSQILTPKLGMSKFVNYVKKFNYGNQDLSGDIGKNNGLTHAWLSSSLQISPEEQTIFLQKLIDNKLPVNIRAQEMTRNICYVEDLADGWKLYAKTGSGSVLSPDKTQKLERQIGWYIGWIQKDNRSIVFAHYFEDEEPQETAAGPRAKAAAKEKLIYLIKSMQT
jgi:beta-lactamase class D